MSKFEILLPLPFAGTFTYEARAPLELGQLVIVPFKFMKITGLVWAISSKKDIKGIKEVYEVTNYHLPLQLLNFIEKVSAYNLIPKGLVLKMVLSVKQVFAKDFAYKEDTNKALTKLADLTPEQESAAAQIINNLSQGHSVTVLDGITGSGKTEVYLHAISAAMKQGKQCLVLLPEIVLTSQLIERFSLRFNFKPLEWHSALTPKARREGWLAAYHGDAKFIVGARSALFLPYKNLGLIVVDEEHDQSYKQEEGQIYNARDMAVLRASLEGIPIVLSSATPSVETTYNAMSKKYKSIHLHSRFGQAKLPEVIIADLTKNPLAKGEWISSQLEHEIKANLASGKQSMLFLNRRGYAPITLCGNCLHKISCPNCNFYLVEHRAKKILQCHYCGYNDSLGKACSNCGSNEKQFAVGPGVERLEEETKKKFPQARTIILTSDTMGNRKSVEAILESITKREIDIIIGTQMVTKGLHFPHLELVGVIDADSSMMCGDIRALERTYQLLYQVSGRAGRESDRGKVIFQTLDPENVVLKNLLSGSRDDFINAELENRQAANMPPFSRIVLITITSKKEELNLQVARHLAQTAPVTEETRILGPSPAPIFLLRRQYRHRFVVIASRNLNIQKLVEQWISTVKAPSQVKIKIDVDPYNFT